MERFNAACYNIISPDSELHTVPDCSGGRLFEAMSVHAHEKELEWIIPGKAASYNIDPLKHRTPIGLTNRYLVAFHIQRIVLNIVYGIQVHHI